eukprot:364213-Chlamydomonas_euryale.AAC.9
MIWRRSSVVFVASKIPAWPSGAVESLLHSPLHTAQDRPSHHNLAPLFCRVCRVEDNNLAVCRPQERVHVCQRSVDCLAAHPDAVLVAAKCRRGGGTGRDGGRMARRGQRGGQMHGDKVRIPMPCWLLQSVCVCVCVWRAEGRHVGRIVTRGSATQHNALTGGRRNLRPAPRPLPSGRACSCPR